MRRWIGQAGVVAAILFAGCFYLPPATTLTIVSPGHGSTTIYNSGITFEATAFNAAGLKSLELDAGGVNGVPDSVLSVCRASGGSVTTLDCQATVIPADNTSLVVNGTLSLSATAVTTAGAVTSRTISVAVSYLACSFDRPAVTSGSNPPSAVVSGEDPVTIGVTNAFPISEVLVTSDTSVSVALWEFEPYTTTVDWCAVLGSGTHGLTVSCQDNQGNTGSNTLQVDVQCSSSRCTSDAQCSPPTPRCDTNVQQCVQCATLSDCPAGEDCIQDVCMVETTCVSNVDCPFGEVCDPLTSICIPAGPDAGF
jgi:hypothetical protein